MQSSFVTRVKGRETYGTSLVAQWLGLHAVTAVAQVQSLVRELRYCKLHCAPKNKKSDFRYNSRSFFPPGRLPIRQEAFK